MSRRFDDRSRKLARERYWNEHDKARYTCPDCGRGRDEIVGEFQVHHKSGNPHDNRLEHLVGLCGFCHRLREDKKPSIERIRRFRRSQYNQPQPNRDSQMYAEKFVDYHACLCSEGRDYAWLDPIGVWFSQLESWMESMGMECNNNLKTELVFALMKAPETSVRWESGQLVVIGPDAHGRCNCDCLTQEDLSLDNVGDRDD